MLMTRKTSFLAMLACAALAVARQTVAVIGAVAVAHPFAMAVYVFMDWLRAPKAVLKAVCHCVERMALALRQARQYMAQRMKRSDLWPQFNWCSPM